MILITISGVRTERKALLYEHRGQQGRRAYVPTYAAWAICHLTDQRLDFAVVRDTSPQLFETLPDPYATGGECPPSTETPYRGLPREDGRIGFRIQLFEEHLGQEVLIGRGTVPRRHVQIHVGAAASHGCIAVAGRRRWYYRQFAPALREMIGRTDDIRVMVLPR